MREDLDLKQHVRDLEAENDALVYSNTIHKIVSAVCLLIVAVVLFQTCTNI
jgi:hypothetical protein